MFELTDKVAIVTGAGRGIGKSVALGFARAGADVVVAARTASDLKTTAAEARGLGRKALAVPTDVRDRDQVDGLVKTTLDAFGRIINVGSVSGTVLVVHGGGLPIVTV